MKCVFLTVGKTSLWDVKGTDSQCDDDCDFEKPTAKRKNENHLKEMLNKTFVTTRRGF